MKKLNIFMLLTCIVTTFACKKNKDNDPEIEEPIVLGSISEYSQLKVGNYWIYQEYALDTAGNNPTSTAIYDTCTVEKDTTIRGNIYHKLVTTPYDYFFSPEFLRDSADCIVNSQGTIKLSLSNFSTPFYSYCYVDFVSLDTMFKASFWMTDKNFSTSVPAGTFTTINAQARYYIFPTPPIDIDGAFRNLNTKSAKNVGRVSITKRFYLSGQAYKELRLAKYHVN